MKRSAVLIVAVLLSSLATGCVTRRYVITSDPPGAVVYLEDQPIGATPVDQPFEYYGKVRLRLVKDGYQPLDVMPEMVPPWYQWPGFDIVSEVFIPYTFRDVQQLHVQLQPLQSVRPDSIRARAEQLRQRGSMIQTPPGTESAPKRNAPRQPAVVPGPGPVVPAPVVPGPGPVVPAPGQVLPAPTPVPALGAPRPAGPPVTPSGPDGRF